MCIQGKHMVEFLQTRTCMALGAEGLAESAFGSGSKQCGHSAT